MIDLITQPAALVPSSRPWPDRDWESMPGAFLDQSTIQSMRADSLHRDIHREEARLEAWEMVHEQHLWAREHNPGTPPDTGIYLFSADMGEGKSHLMLCYALLAWMFRAVPVFSSESMGALFGYGIRLDEVYNFSDVLPPGSILLVDELAAIADSMAGQANRGRVLHAGLTSFRKGGNLALTATASEWNISPQLKIAMRAVIEPKRTRPTKRVVTSYDSRGRPKLAQLYLREHELEYPRFCYLKAEGLLAPWVGRRAHEDYRQALHESRNPRRQPGKAMDPRWKPSKVLTPSPFYMDLASKLYDTHMRVPTSDSHSIDADVMRASAERARGETSIPGLIAWLNQQHILREYQGLENIQLKDLHETAKAYSPVFERMSRRRFGRELTEEIGEEAVGRTVVKLKALSGTRKRRKRDG